MLGIDRQRVSLWVRDGLLREVQLGTAKRIPMSEVERLERDGLPPPEARPRRRKRTAPTSTMTDAEVAAVLAKF